jgi:PPK2 family polyphosphate:nucleotide phosphotransferase
MSSSDHLAKASRLIRPFRITDGQSFRLKDVDPDDTGGIKSKEHAADMLARGVDHLCDLHEKLYAQGTWALLLIFQAMDAAGKDSTIKHVMSGLNPQGCEVFSFKAPSAEDLAHDFLWRTTRCLPERGRIGVFNRSYYEEVLIVRVHPQILTRQRLPPAVVSGRIWEERFEDINAFERHMRRSGVVIRKFFLHVSKEEQRRRFLARIEQPAKNWKFSESDALERACWRDYMAAYQDMIRHTATRNAPWYVVPADHKWFTRLVVAAAVEESLAELDLSFPRIGGAKRKELEAARAALEREKR